jgi:hypothetical protein
VNFAAFNGDVLRELSTQFLMLAQKHGAASMKLIGHRLMGTSLMYRGDIVESRSHFEDAIALYDPIQYKPTRFGQHPLVSTLCCRSWIMWMLGYPDVALADAVQAITEARHISEAVTLMFALSQTAIFNQLCRRYDAAKVLIDEHCALADEKGSGFWKTFGLLQQAILSAMTAKAIHAVDPLILGIDAWKSTGSTTTAPHALSWLASTYSDLGRHDDASRTMGDALTAIQISGEGCVRPKSIVWPGKSRLCHPSRMP